MPDRSALAKTEEASLSRFVEKKRCVLRWSRQNASPLRNLACSSYLLFAPVIWSRKDGLIISPSKGTRSANSSLDSSDDIGFLKTLQTDSSKGNSRERSLANKSERSSTPFPRRGIEPPGLPAGDRENRDTVGVTAEKEVEEFEVEKAIISHLTVLVDHTKPRKGRLHLTARVFGAAGNWSKCSVTAPIAEETPIFTVLREPKSLDSVTYSRWLTKNAFGSRQPESMEFAITFLQNLGFGEKIYSNRSLVLVAQHLNVIFPFS